VARESISLNTPEECSSEGFEAPASEVDEVTWWALLCCMLLVLLLLGPLAAAAGVCMLQKCSQTM
jgi:hypothetical protein